MLVDNVVDDVDGSCEPACLYYANVNDRKHATLLALTRQSLTIIGKV